MWFDGSPDRVASAVLLVARIIFKRAAIEAPDVQTVAAQCRESAAPSQRLGILTAILSHVTFARVGAEAVSALVRDQPGQYQRFTKRGLTKVQTVLKPLEKKHSMKLTDYSRTMTGEAYLNQVLSKPNLIDKMNEGLDALDACGILTVADATFCETVEAVSQLPLYGRTRAANLARCLSACRVLLGRAPLSFTPRCWAICVGMRKNVKAASELMGVQTLQQAEEACRVLSVVCAASYRGSKARCFFTPMEPADLCLVFCEYQCVLAEIDKRNASSRQKAREFLLDHLPKKHGCPSVASDSSVELRSIACRRCYWLRCSSS